MNPTQRDDIPAKPLFLQSAKESSPMVQLKLRICVRVEGWNIVKGLSDGEKQIYYEEKTTPKMREENYIG